MPGGDRTFNFYEKGKVMSFEMKRCGTRGIRSMYVDRGGKKKVFHFGTTLLIFSIGPRAIYTSTRRGPLPLLIGLGVKNCFAGILGWH